jgi:NADH:ubiquinone reductase (H+-translocating)
MAKRVLCLGGGYAAMWFAKALKKSIRKGDLDVTIVSRENFHAFHGFVHEMLTGKLQPGQIISPLRRVFPPAKFVNCEIESIDLKTQAVTASRLLDGRQYTLEYDHLMIALGSMDDLSRYAGIAEHAQKLKTYSDCLKARDHILTMLELAAIESDKDERRRLLTFVIAGGNFGGIEVATDLHEYLHSLIKREYAHISPDELKIVVVHSGGRILPELERFPKLVTWAEKRIGQQRIEIRLNSRVSAATAEEVVLTTGERIPSRTIVSCTGTAQSPVLDGLDLPRDERGRLVTDEFLRVKGYTNVWAAGDCAAVPHPQGGKCPALAIFALTGGKLIARNIVRHEAGQPPEPYRFTGLGDAVSLGGRTAVGHLRGFTFTGLIAWIAWRMLLLSFVPTWDRRVRMVVDWSLWPIVGRDIVSLGVDRPYGIRRELFEPEQDIVRQGDIGQRLYLIWSGEVDVIRSENGQSKTVAKLGPGQHFGETSVFEGVRRTATVRARTRVELLSIGQQEAIAMTSVSAELGGLRRRPQAAP